MEVNEIWLSSRDHQDQFNKIHQNNSRIRKILGLYKIPSNFPYKEILWQKFPIVYNNICSLEVNENRLIIKSKHEFGFFNSLKNINSGYNQIILIKKISNISRYKNQYPFMENFNINWICIRFSDSKIEKELLFCVGGKLMNSIKKETDKVYELIGRKLD